MNLADAIVAATASRPELRMLAGTAVNATTVDVGASTNVEVNGWLAAPAAAGDDVLLLLGGGMVWGARIA